MSGRLLFRFLRFVIRWRLANKLENALEMSLLNLKISYFRDNTSFVVRVAQGWAVVFTSSKPQDTRTETNTRVSTPLLWLAHSQCLPARPGSAGTAVFPIRKRGIRCRGAMSRRDGVRFSFFDVFDWDSLDVFDIPQQ